MTWVRGTIPWFESATAALRDAIDDSFEKQALPAPPAGFEPAHTAPETVARVAAAPTLTWENTLPSCLPGRCSLATLSRCPERRRAPRLCRWSARHAREPGHLAWFDHVLPGPAVSR